MGSPDRTPRGTPRLPTCAILRGRAMPLPGSTHGEQASLLEAGRESPDVGIDGQGPVRIRPRDPVRGRALSTANRGIPVRNRAVRSRSGALGGQSWLLRLGFVPNHAHGGLTFQPRLEPGIN